LRVHQARSEDVVHDSEDDKQGKKKKGKDREAKLITEGDIQHSVKKSKANSVCLKKKWESQDDKRQLLSFDQPREKS